MIYSTPILSLIIYAFPAVLANVVLFPIQEQLPLIARVNQPYSWTISTKTFSDSSNVVASRLPSWLSFSNYTLSGMPTPDDEGNPRITVTAGNASDDFTICVTPFPPPVVVIPLADQFNSSNPSFSSVFALRPNSALTSSVPALRVPPNWSFSVGFEGRTFSPTNPDKSLISANIGNSNLFYAALQTDGTPLPPWLVFDPHTITFNGVSRSPPVFDPDRLSIVLVASDQQGYAAVYAPFDIVVAAHELSTHDTGLTLYATDGEVLDINFGMDAAVPQALLIDDVSLRASNITALKIDTSNYPWLGFDSASLSLRGMPPAPAQNQAIVLPMSLSAINQTLLLSASVTFVPSYFNAASFKSVSTPPGSALAVSINSYISKDYVSNNHVVNLTAVFDPSSAGSYLQLDQDLQSKSWRIYGNIPSDVSYPTINITVTAYDQTTRASSHLTGLITLDPGSASANGSGSDRNRKLALGLGVGFGTVSGLVIFFGVLALCRRYCAAKDTALDPYADEKAAYIMDSEVHGYGWSEKLGLASGSGTDPRRNLQDLYSISPPLPKHTASPGIGRGAAPTSAGRMIKKGAFFDGVKATIRQFSGSISRGDKTKAMIGKPVLIFTKDSAGSLDTLCPGPDGLMTLRNGAQSDIALAGSYRSVDALEVDGISLGLDSSSSPSSSTGHTGASTQSVPTRRPDFGPPRAMLGVVPTPVRTLAHQPNQHMRRQSTDSQRSGSSGNSEEAVLATASRAPSVRSTYSGVAVMLEDAAARPRLVQFTSARGVPSPVPSLPTIPGGGRQVGQGEKPRRASQVAQVYAGASAEGDDAILNEGLRYVRAFGNQPEEQHLSPALSARSRAPTTSTGRTGLASHSPIPTQTSYMYPSPSASFDSALDGGSTTTMSRILVGTGEAFAFKFPVSTGGAVGEAVSARKLTAALLYGGGPLPVYLSYAHTSGSGRSAKRDEVEFWGTPRSDDVGEVVIGVFDEDGGCVGRLVVEVVGRG